MPVLPAGSAPLPCLANVSARGRGITAALAILDIADRAEQPAFGRPPLDGVDGIRRHHDQHLVAGMPRPRAIVYVSCNPRSQARELGALKEIYAIEAVQPVDLFPHTHHIENVIKLRLRG